MNESFAMFLYLRLITYTPPPSSLHIISLPGIYIFLIPKIQGRRPSNPDSFLPTAQSRAPSIHLSPKPNRSTNR